MCNTIAHTPFQFEPTPFVTVHMISHVNPTQMHICVKNIHPHNAPTKKFKKIKSMMCNKIKKKKLFYCSRKKIYLQVRQISEFYTNNMIIALA